MENQLIRSRESVAQQSINQQNGGFGLVASSYALPLGEENLRQELNHVQSQLQAELHRLEACGEDINKLEKDIFSLRNQLRSSVERDRGRTSQNTLDMETHLRLLQGRAMDLETQRAEVLQHINQLRGNYLFGPFNSLHISSYSHLVKVKL